MIANLDISAVGETSVDPRFTTPSYNATVPEPILYIVAQCDNSALEVKSLNSKFEKESMSHLAVITDILILIVMITFYNVIRYNQKDYCKHFDDVTIEAKDFTLQIHQLPLTFAQYKDELSIKYAIWNQIQQKINFYKENKMCFEELDSTIIDIHFAMRDIELLERQRKIA